MTDYLIDTNILIYHTKGSQLTADFIGNVIAQQAFNISILTKIEFLGWDKHSPDGFEKCKKLIELANVFPLDEDIANKTIEMNYPAASSGVSKTLNSVIPHLMRNPVRSSGFRLPPE